MQRDRILIVSASTGTGHRSAGEALRNAVLEASPGAAVEHVDLLNLAPRWVRAAYGSGYELISSRTPWLWHQIYRHTDGATPDRARWSPLAHHLLFREFRALLLSRPWRACVCTHFLPAQLAARLPGAPPFSLAITDFTLHRFWVQPGVRRYFVATDALAAELRGRAPGARVQASGIPISPSFSRAPGRAEARAELGLDPSRTVALVMGGGLGLGVEEMARATLAAEAQNLQVVAICGRNEVARQQLGRAGHSPDRLRLEGYVGGVERYIAAADFVVTKPGGLTCSEALALGRPLVLTRAIPGQETGNSRALEEFGAALVAKKARDVRQAVETLAGTPGTLRRIAAAARRIGKPRAAHRVAGAVLRTAPPRDAGSAPPRMLGGSRRAEA